jgi:hypothetical protein
MAGKNRLLAKILGNNDGLLTPDSDLLAVAVTKNIPAAVGINVYSNIDDLPTSASAGEKALVTSTNTLYLYNGGWYRIALINNFNPQWVTQPAATYDLAINSTPTVITMLATDSDDVPIKYVATTDSGFNAIATVSHDSDKHNVFTIIPTDSENGAATGGTGTITFKATDGVNQVQQVSTFSLSFGPDWSGSVTETKLKASDPQLADQFGQFVAISGDGAYAIVGAPQEDTGGNAAGAAYIYVRSGNSWSQQQKIVSSNIGAGDEFGCAVSMNSDGTYAIVGAWAEDTSATTAGSAYIFTRSGTTWTQQAQIQASPAASNDYFGISVEITPDANYAIVGAYFSSGTNGAAYVFSRSGTSWTQQAKLVASDAASADYFGWHVAISSDGSYAIVGANGQEDTGGSNDNHGASYIYVRSGTSWSQQAKIQSSDTAAGDKFGWRVAINSDGTYAAATSYLSPTGAVTHAGGVYVFTRSGTSWTQQAKLVASDAASYDFFGKGLAINSSGDHIVIGARGNDRDGGSGETDSGAVFIFTRSGTTWSQIKELNHANPATSDYFGDALGISTDASYVIVGAYGEDTTAAGSGAAYIFEAG